MTENVAKVQAAASPLWRTALVAIGNVLLGGAVGLLAYGGLTDLSARAEQDRLRSDGYLSGSVRLAETPGTAPALDFEGWEGEDRAYWTALPRGGVFGRLVADALSLDCVVVRGTERADLAKGPGWIEWTNLPGPSGNVGVSGHRTTFGAPFRDIDRLQPGDTIDLYSPFRRYRYVVTGQEAVTPDRTEVVSATPEPMLTLTACHPPYSARYRLIVHAKLTEVRRLEEQPAP